MSHSGTNPAQICAHDRWRPEIAELDMLFVLHGVEGAAAALLAGGITAFRHRDIS